MKHSHTIKMLTAGLAIAAFAGVAAADHHGSCSSSKKVAQQKSSCGSESAGTVTLAAYSNTEGGHKDIVDTAVGAGSFNTLVAAVKAAGLVNALKGDGPFTVFAPTDEAFAKLPKGTLDSLLKPENKGTLQAILTYHVVPGSLAANDVVRMNGSKTLNGQRVDFAVEHGKAMIDNATIVKTDIGCSNGVIHVIDTVILPSTDNIVTTANSAGKFNTLLTAAKAAGLAELLQSEGPFTVLAPTDAAFDKLPKGTVESLLKHENRDQLAAILKYHVVPGRVFASDAVAAGMADTALGRKISFDIRNGRLFVNGIKVIATDIDASNGVIHVVDEVILPE